jgi:hypothetical protein
MADAEQGKPRSQAEFDRELAEIRLMKEKLELEELQHNVDTAKMKREERQAHAKRNGRDLAAIIEGGQRAIANCNHKKGGKGMEGFRGHGNDNHYAVIKHQLPNSTIAVMCQRCPKIWLPPVPIHRQDFENQRDYDFAKREFAKARAEYDWALALPTDNEMSTSGLWTGYTKDGVPFQEAALKVYHQSAAAPMVE